MVSYDVIICMGNSFQYNKHIVEGGVGQERLPNKEQIKKKRNKQST